MAGQAADVERWPPSRRAWLAARRKPKAVPYLPAIHNGITVEAGQVQQATFDDDGQLRMNQSTPVEMQIVPSTKRPGGMGGTATVWAASALGNAIFAATGKRVREPPRLAALSSGS